jgi:antitoxin FitA
MHVPHMNKHIQIRNVPDSVHRKLKIRATEKGLSLSDYLREEMERLTARPTLKEMAERLRKLPAANLDPPPEALIREDRDSR